MKRDFLESLGLDKAGIDAIMTENGKSIEALRQRCEALEEEIRTLREEKEESLRKTAEDGAEIKRLRTACEQAEASGRTSSPSSSPKLHRPPDSRRTRSAGCSRRRPNGAHRSVRRSPG